MAPGLAASLQHAGRTAGWWSYPSPAHASGPPAWVSFTVVGLILLGCLIAGAWCAVCSVREWQRRGDAGHDEGDGDDGGGGGGRRRKPPPPVGPRDGDPVWWPEFEREFAAYVANRLTPAR